MSYEIYGWLMVIILFALVALLLVATWIIAVENGYDKGFKSGYKRGSTDTRQSAMKVQKVTVSNHPTLRTKQLQEDNDYLMEKVVSLWDRENR
jgi:uncharacterized ion transporter superfamily protein YfcC